MAVCTYDNPATMARECWQDGKLICHYAFQLLPPFSKEPIPAERFFFGANIGPWKLGQMVGDAEAMSSNVRVEPGHRREGATMTDKATESQPSNTPGALGSNEGLGGYITAALLAAATMTDEAESRAYRGYCPKCKHLTLAIKHRDHGVVFKGCDVCGSMVVLRDDAQRIAKGPAACGRSRLSAGLGAEDEE